MDSFFSFSFPLPKSFPVAQNSQNFLEEEDASWSVEYRVIKREFKWKFIRTSIIRWANSINRPTNRWGGRTPATSVEFKEGWNKVAFWRELFYNIIWDQQKKKVKTKLKHCKTHPGDSLRSVTRVAHKLKWVHYQKR